MATGAPDHGSARESVAVIGAGVAGLTAAYLLQRRHDVTLFESDSRLGGHAHTHELMDIAGTPQSVDTGFIVHNRRTYPNLLRLFAELDVPTQGSEMSMSVSCAGCGLEYAGARGLRGVFAQRSAMANPRFIRMLIEIKRFHRQAHALLATPGDRNDPVTLGEFLAAGRFGDFFVNHFMLPVVSCVWSCGNELATEYPARYLFEFLDNHGMLSVSGSPSWRTVMGGSQTYVRRAVKQLTAVRTATPVRVVERSDSGVTVRTEDDEQQRFDRVVVATHPDQALRLLAEPTPAERAVLGAFRYSRAATVLHTDTSLLPAAPGARASWNYLLPSCSGRDGGAVHVAYDMNRLQRLESATPYLVTLNSSDRIDPRTVIDTMTYEHPIYTPASVAAQQRLPDLTTVRTAFAGAYHGWGFHEDGCASGVRAAHAFGVGFGASS